MNGIKKDNRVYSWGFGKYGQIGKKFINYATNPVKIDHSKLNFEEVDKIYAGENFTMILSKTPKLYNFGKNNFGQLGLNTGNKDQVIHYISSPSLNLISCQYKVSKISCGGDHTILLTQEKLVLTFGMNIFGQLGLGYFSTYDSTPRLINFEDEDTSIHNLNRQLLKNEYITEVCAGSHHSLLLSNFNNIFSCGCNRTNALAKNDYKEIKNDQDLLNLANYCIFEKMENKIIFKNSITNISAGLYHSSCIVDDDKVYFWGIGEILEFEEPKIIFDLTKGYKDDEKVIQVSIGHDFAIIQTKLSVYSIGINNKGQLGFKNNNQSQQFSLEISKLNFEINKSYNLSSISVGAEHAISVFKLDKNINDNTSLNENENKIEDKKENENDLNTKIEEELISSSLVFGWGSNEFGQLSLDDKLICYEPTLLSKLNGYANIICGGYHCVGNIYEESNANLELSTKIIGKSSSMTVLDSKKSEINKINTDQNITKSIKRINSMDNLNNQDDNNQNVISQMKKLFYQMPLSSTLKNDYFFIDEKQKILKELNDITKKLDDTLKKNENKIEELNKKKKELTSKGLIKDSSRGITNDFEIDIKEIKLINEIGSGTFGKVYRAKWRKTFVAVKYMKPEYTNNEKLMKEFLEECVFMKNLRHPNILMFMGAGTKGTDNFIILEMCDNNNLFYILHRCKEINLDWEWKRRVALEICYGMHYLHSFNPPIVHRDLKSMNVLLTKNWTVKVADFGNTKFLDTHMSKSKGTFQWMAPEVISYTNYTQMADVFSFGIIMHEIYSRTPPYSGVDKVVVSKKVAKDPNYRPPIDKNIPNDWKEIMKKCWDFDPQKRPTFSKLIDMLKSAKL